MRVQLDPNVFGRHTLTRNLQMFFLNTARSNICAKYKFLKRLFANNISFSFFNEILRTII